MYAITFDLDVEMLKASYHPTNYPNAYAEIRRILGNYGFSPQQGSVYFGDSQADAVKCVIAVQDLAARFPWFPSSVRDIRMLRIEENNDLMPAINSVGAARVTQVLQGAPAIPLKNKVKSR